MALRLGQSPVDTFKPQPVEVSVYRGDTMVMDSPIRPVVTVGSVTLIAWDFVLPTVMSVDTGVYRFVTDHFVGVQDQGIGWAYGVDDVSTVYLKDGVLIVADAFGVNDSISIRGMVNQWV